MRGSRHEWSSALLVLAVLTLCARPAQAEVPRVPWLDDPAWSAVLARSAADSGRSILLDFHAPWCGPCRLMDAMVYNEAEVVAELADVVTVRYDIDVPANRAVRDSFAVELLPTLVWCDRTGAEIDRFTGYRNKAEFLEAVRTFRREEASSRTIAERLEAAPDDPALLLEAARFQDRRGRHRQAETAYRRLIALGAQAAPELQVGGLLGLALCEQRAGRADAARDLARRAGRVGAGTAEVVAFQEASGDTAGLLETWRVRVAADDMDVVALDGFARAATALGVDLEEASRCAVRAVVLSDRKPDVILTLAEVYSRRGLHGRALRWIGEARAAAPDDPVIAAAEERYRQDQARDPWGYGIRSR